MEMKTTIFAVFALAVLALSGTAFASINPKVQLMNYTLSEVPAQPGQRQRATVVGEQRVH